MKKKTIEKRKREKKERIKEIFLESILYITIAGIVIFLFAIFDFGKKWDSIKEGNITFIALVSLIIFRLCLYFVPGFIGYCIIKPIKKPETKNKKILLFIDCYNIQFFVYSLVLSLYELFALDYVLNVDIFTKMDSFIFILGFIISVFIRHEIPKDEIEQLDVEESKK